MQPPSRYPFHIMTKPIGPVCNLDCTYCFYLEKEDLYAPSPDRSWRMSDTLLETYIRQYLEQNPAPEVTFAWQGGEPTLLGVDFFRKAVTLQKQYGPGRTIHNALQTNGTLFDDAWCQFFHEEGFLIGISIDGPRDLHDHYRVDKQHRPTFDAVLRGVELLKGHQVEFNTLTVVNRTNATKPLEVYRFLKEQVGSQFLQFIPLVERQEITGKLGSPPGGRANPSLSVTPWSVDPDDFGQFLCTIYDHWVRHDVGRIFIQLFDMALGCYMGMPPSLCVFAETCGRALAMEHNGDLYSCDHYVYPQYHLGNILQQPMATLVDSPQQTAFGHAKRDTLTAYCRQCPVLPICNGDCPKHRFATTPTGEPGLSYLCPAYRRFFQHIAPTMRTMAQLLQARRPAADIMPLLTHPRPSRPTSIGRNDPCPCGSGRKYKRCCGTNA